MSKTLDSARMPRLADKYRAEEEAEKVVKKPAKKAKKK